MAFRPKSPGWNSVAAALGAVAVLGLSAGPARAQQSDPMDDLLEKLKNKGVLSEDEYQALKKAREEEQIELRNERRRQAQKAAQNAEKEEKEKEAAAKKTRFDASPGIKSIQLFGDVRLRYESRVGTSNFPITGFPITGAATAPANAADSEALDRWRYAVRVGIRGDLSDDWFYGLRLDTGTNPRSAWVTFGNSIGAAGGAAPYGKTGDGIFVGQAYMGWRATPWLTVQAGRMPNPVFTTPMVWDPDINPDGIAERINFPLNDSLTLFGNFGQYVYAQFSPSSSSGALNFNSYEGYQFAWQGGVNYKFAEKTTAKVAVTFYNYSGFSYRAPFMSAAQNNTSNGFAGPFANGPIQITPNSAAGLSFANGLNSLRYFEVPFEVNFPISSLSARAFGDAAYNIQANQRAAQGSFASLGSQGLAWQLGLAVGTNIGLSTNSVAAKKNTWEARAFWQQIDLNALDPNLIDSDFFEGRTNLQGVFLAFAYSPTDAIITTIRFGEAHRLNANGPTPGSNPDIPLVQPITNYRLLQLDLTWKF